MKLIVGLGNPGPQYERTRHNAGFLALDRLTGKHARSAMVRQRFGGQLVEADLAGERCLLLKPLRFMNCSGASVGEALNFYKLSPAADLLVLVDDYALPLGSIRVRAEGGPGGHNGLADIQRVLGTQAYPRVRIGIDSPPPGYSDPADWVLGRFTDDNLQSLEPALTATVLACEAFVSGGVTLAMNRFNARPRPAAQPGTPAQPLSSNHQPQAVHPRLTETPPCDPS